MPWPDANTLQATKAEAAKAAGVTGPADRIAVGRMSGQCPAGLKTHPAVAGAVGRLKAAMARITQPGVPVAGACLVALCLSILVAPAPVADNFGPPPVCILSCPHLHPIPHRPSPTTRLQTGSKPRMLESWT